MVSNRKRSQRKRSQRKRSKRSKRSKRKKYQKAGSTITVDKFEPNFKNLLRRLEGDKTPEQIRSALIENIKDFIIFDIKHKGRLITGDVKIFSIKESHKSTHWKDEHKSFFSKIKEWGHGSTPSTQIYYQWWAYILKKCKKYINRRIPGLGYKKMPGFGCKAWGNAGEKLFNMIDVEYNQGNENMPLSGPNMDIFVKGKNSLVHQAKILAFEEISKNPDLVNPNVSTGGRKLSKRKYRKRSQRRRSQRRKKRSQRRK